MNILSKECKILNYMNKKINPEQALVARLTKLQLKLSFLFSNSSFEELCRVYKDVVPKLIYFVKYLARSVTAHERARAVLRDCAKIVVDLVQATEYERYGHDFPLFHFFVQCYEQHCEKLNYLNKQQVLARAQKNQQSPYYLHLQKTPITPPQLQFPKTPSFPSILQSLTSNEIPLQNPHCICCSQVFIHNMPLHNSNALFQCIVSLTLRPGHEEDLAVLGRVGVGLCNRGGGVAVVGVDRTREGFFVAGVRFCTGEMVVGLEKAIHEELKKISPPCRYTVQQVLAHSNYVERKEKDIKEEYLRVCLRIVVFPHSLDRVSYLQVIKKGVSMYEAYTFPRTPIRPQSDLPQKCQSIYTTIHKSYHLKQHYPQNNHENILCFPPYPFYSKLFYSKMLSSSMVSSQAEEMGLDGGLGSSQGQDQGQGQSEELMPIQPEIEQYEKEIEEPVLKSELKFKYSRNSLLVVTTAKHDREVLAFASKLEENKMLVQLSKPFPELFQNNTRPVWILSHQMKFTELKKQLNSCQFRKEVKDKTIKMMPVTTNLQIKASKYTEFVENRLKTRFVQRYGDGYRAEVIESTNKDQELQYVVQLGFNNYEESVFAYMVLEELEMRPFFSKEGTVYKKKGY